jgi:hypothetical protein
MAKERESTAPERVSCDVCLKQVPKSEAQSPEASDYVLYFCGLDCYEKWKQQKDPEGTSSEPRKGARPAASRRQ